MKKRKTWQSVMICCMVGVLLFYSLVPETVQAATTKKWKKEYTTILKDWTKVEKYENLEYLKMYFGSQYKFDKYFLCDVDKNGVPELILCSSTMGLQEILTYKSGKIVSLGYDDYYKINTTKHTAVVKGHWHGAGGSGDKEYSIYKVDGKKMSTLYYIDKLFGKYYIYKGDNWKKLKGTKTNYNKVYTKYVKGGKLISKYKKYKLSDTSGLKSY